MTPVTWLLVVAVGFMVVAFVVWFIVSPLVRDIFLVALRHPLRGGTVTIDSCDPPTGQEEQESPPQAREASREGKREHQPVPH